MQARNYVDISFTVLDRVRQGRRLLRDLDTGQAYYDPPEPVVEEVNIESYLVTEPAPTLTKSVAKRVKAQAKRLLHG